MIRKITSDWRFFWAVQLIVMLAIALCATFLPLFFPGAYLPLKVVFLWLLPSAAGAVTACRLTRIGLISYAAWLLPPIVHTLTPWLILGFPPSIGSALVCAFVSLVGAAAGDVLQRRDNA